MNIVTIPLDKIDVGERLREVDPDYVQLIAASMADCGQRTPIEVRTPDRRGMHALIAGAHRVAALRAAGEAAAHAIVLKVSDLQARMLEIDENLSRRELNALDRATFLAQRKAVYEELHPETKNGGDRRSDQNDKLVVLIGRLSFSEATATRLGLDKRSIQRAVMRHLRLAPDVRPMIQHTWLADSGSQLDAFVKMPPSSQRIVAASIETYPDVRSVSELVRLAYRQPEPTRVTDYDRFLALWRKADRQTRARIVEYVAVAGKAADVSNDRDAA